MLWRCVSVAGGWLSARRRGSSPKQQKCAVTTYDSDSCQRNAVISPPPLRSAEIPGRDRLIRALPIPRCEHFSCRLFLVLPRFHLRRASKTPPSCPPSRSTRPRSSRSSVGSARSLRSQCWRPVTDRLACRYTTEEFDELCFEFGMLTWAVAAGCMLT